MIKTKKTENGIHTRCPQRIQQVGTEKWKLFCGKTNATIIRKKSNTDFYFLNKC